jgi:hypothetical protein
MKHIFRKTEFLILVGIVTSILYLLSACKKEDDPKEVSFDASPGDFVLKVDSIADSTGVDGPMYSESVRISNDFFRTACETHNVYLGDVQSIKIKSASVSIHGMQPADFGDFKKIFLHTWFGQYGYTLLGDNPSPNAASSTQSLSVMNVELKEYFMLLDQDFFLYLTQNSAAFNDTVEVTVSVNFSVTGMDH